ncbi:hypothetical protein QWA68_016072 [Fusarium oxysporum]|nr:hypothetical protein QWA68_016072 [Fusarium oxysporum]
MYILHAPADEVVTECFKLVLDAGADVNHVDSAGNTPLYEVQTSLVAQLLLNSGADPNARNN